MNKKIISFTAGAVLLSALAVLPAIAKQSSQCMLLQLHQDYFTNCMGTVEHTRMAGNKEVDSYIVGMGSGEAATIRYELKGRFDVFESMVGFRDSAPESRLCTFELWADSVLIKKIGPLRPADGPDILRGNIKKAKVITLRMVPDKYNGTAGAMWGNPKLMNGVSEEDLNDASMVVHVNGELMQLTPDKSKGMKRVSIPFPVKPGINEYKVTTKVDEASGKMEVVYGAGTPATEEPLVIENAPQGFGTGK